MHGAGRSIRWIALRTERKLRAREQAFERRLNPALESPHFPALREKFHQAVHVVFRFAATICPVRKVRENHARARLLRCRRLGSAHEDLAPAWCIARSCRMKRPSNREREDVRMARSVQVVLRAANKLLQSRRALQFPLVDERSGDVMRTGFERNASRT